VTDRNDDVMTPLPPAGSYALDPVHTFSELRVNVAERERHGAIYGVCKSRRVGPSGAVARLVVVVSLVTHQASDHVLCVLGMNRPGVHGDADLAPAVGLIRSLSARRA
jgi:hypothetical protein